MPNSQLKTPQETKLKLTLELDLTDGTEGFTKFCTALAQAGFTEQLLQLREMFFAEADKRGIKLETGVAK